MTTDAINEAIAKHQKWEYVPEDCEDYPWQDAEGEGHRHPPDYCEDLNAISKAEETLTSNEWEVWHKTVSKLFLTDEQPYHSRLSARQRAEAFLKTVGKWEEEKSKDSIGGEEITTSHHFHTLEETGWRKRAERAEEFLRMIQETIQGGGRVVTFQQCDLEEMEDILLNTQRDSKSESETGVGNSKSQQPDVRNTLQPLAGKAQRGQDEFHALRVENEKLRQTGSGKREDWRATVETTGENSISQQPDAQSTLQTQGLPRGMSQAVASMNEAFIKREMAKASIGN